MKIQLSSEAAIEISSIVCVAGCTPTDVITAVLRRGLMEIADDARRYRAYEDCDAGEFNRRGEPRVEHWRQALQLESEQ